MGAPKDNLFALGNAGGRPPKYETPEQLKDKATEYFNHVTDKFGKCRATISGLSSYLGFEDRKSFYDYGKKEEFVHTIKKLRQFVEQCYESHLYAHSAAGAIFALKNINSEHWKDKTEVTTTNVEQPLLEEKKDDE